MAENRSFFIKIHLKRLFTSFLLLLSLNNNISYGGEAALLGTQVAQRYGRTVGINFVTFLLRNLLNTAIMSCFTMQFKNILHIPKLMLELRLLKFKIASLKNKKEPKKILEFKELQLKQEWLKISLKNKQNIATLSNFQNRNIFYSQKIYYYFNVLATLETTFFTEYLTIFNYLNKYFLLFIIYDQKRETVLFFNNQKKLTKFININPETFNNKSADIFRKYSKIFDDSNNFNKKLS